MVNLAALARASLALSQSERKQSESTPLPLVLDYYDREQPALVRYLCFLNVNPQTAEEIVQDCFVKLHEHLQAGGDTANLRAWLYRVAHNLARNSQMSARSRYTDSLSGPELHREPVAVALSPEDTLLQSERLIRLQEAMRQLPGVQRQVLALRSQGLKYREIAEAVGLSTSSVAETIQRAVLALRKLVD